MTQLGMGVAALNHDSKFVEAYDKGMKKTDYWTYALEDSLDLIAKLPALAARIYRNVHHPGKTLAGIDKDQDLVGELYPSNYCDLEPRQPFFKATTPICLATAATRV